VQLLELDTLHPSPGQPRQVFDDQKLAELSDSIKQQGVLVPLLARRARTGYEIIAGERRFRAARQAGLTRVPVVIVEANDQQAYLMALVENLQRDDLGPLEEAEGYRRLVEEFGLTQEEVAARVGKDRSTVTNALRLLRLPALVKDAILDGTLTAGHARALLSLPAGSLERTSRQVIARALSVRATEALVRKVREGETEEQAEKRLARKGSEAARSLEEQLTTALATRVKVREQGHQSGRIEITYHSLDELDRLLNVLIR
jgi:ParB family chromosome partitioning protein